MQRRRDSTAALRPDQGDVGLQRQVDERFGVGLGRDGDGERLGLGGGAAGAQERRGSQERDGAGSLFSIGSGER